MDNYEALTKVLGYNTDEKEIPPIEKDKYIYTTEATKKIRQKEYDDAIAILQKLIKLCRYQGKNSDAYLVEHRIFLCEQMKVYEKAEIPMDAFENLPYVEILKVTLTRLAKENDWHCSSYYHCLNEERNRFRLYGFYVGLNEALCRAQNKMDDVGSLGAALREHSTSGLSIPLNEWQKEEMYIIASEYKKDFEIYK